MSRQVHGTEHGHKASDQQGKIVGSEYHGEDADALVLVSLAQRRVEFRSAGGRHAEISGLHAEKIAMIENCIADKPPAGSHEENSGDKQARLQQRPPFQVVAVYGRGGSVGGDGPGGYLADKAADK